MSDFFEPPPPLPEPPEPEERPIKPWWGPPTNVVGAPVDLGFVLARTEDVAVSVERFSVFPMGVRFHVVVRCRTEKVGMDLGDLEFRGWRSRRGGEIPAEKLRLGVRLSDGSKATNLVSHMGMGEDPEQEPSGPVLEEHGGGGGGRYREWEYWLWPLPPAGSLSFVCEWPAAGMPLTTREVDAGAIREAANHAVTLWPEATLGVRGLSLIGHPVEPRNDSPEEAKDE